MQVLFGGTFDPVHDGHLAMVKSLSHAFPEAVVHVIPNRQPPHRQSHVSSEHRLAMLGLAMANLPQVQVNTIELGRDGPSYTVDTLQALREQFGLDESIVLCLGADAVSAIEQWYQPHRLSSLCHLCVLNRAGESVTIAPVLESFSESDHLSPLEMQPAGILTRLATPDVAVSSTHVRHLIKNKETRLPVPSKIADYIGQHHLYQDTE